VDNCGRDGSRDCGNSRKYREEQNHRSSGTQIPFNASHFNFPWLVLRTRKVVFESTAFESLRRSLTRWLLLYSEARFAKMTGLPDNLTETPHSYA
jgi:hypothetical protein